MDRMEWIIAKAGAEKKALMVFPEKAGEQSARRVFQDKTQWEALEQRFQFSGPYKLVLLAVKSWRKYRRRTKVAVVVKKGPGSDSPNDIVVNGARVEILEEREAGENG